MSAFNVLGAGLYSKLAGGTALIALLHAGSLSIYNTDAPYEAIYDYIIFNVQGGGDTNDSPHRVKDLEVQVRGYTQIGMARAGTIDMQVDALLHRQTLTVSGWLNFWLVRTQEIQLVEYDEANHPIYSCGGLYDVKIEKM